jgi:hypothetical protein
MFSYLCSGQIGEPYIVIKEVWSWLVRKRWVAIMCA